MDAVTRRNLQVGKWLGGWFAVSFLIMALILSLPSKFSQTPFASALFAGASISSYVAIFFCLPGAVYCCWLNGPQFPTQRQFLSRMLALPFLTYAAIWPLSHLGRMTQSLLPMWLLIVIAVTEAATKEWALAGLLRLYKVQNPDV